MAVNHTYTTGTYGGVALNILTTAASNIQLLSFRWNYKVPPGFRLLWNQWRLV